MSVVLDDWFALTAPSAVTPAPTFTIHLASNKLKKMEEIGSKSDLVERVWVKILGMKMLCMRNVINDSVVI